MRALEHEQRLAARERETLEAAEAADAPARRGAARSARRRSAGGSTSGSRPGARRRAARSTHVIADLKAQERRRSRRTRQRRADRPGDTGAARARGARGASTPSSSAFARAGDAGPRATDRRPHGAGAVGDRVIVGGFGLEGDRTRSTTARPRWTCAASACAPASATCGSSAGRAGGAVERHASTSSCSRATALRADLNVIGCTVDEALTRAERFLDETLLDRSAHRAPHSRLRHRPAQARARRVPAAASAGRELRRRAARQGGGGVTVVELKD